jgi:K+-sensing histidine kinase KdpD
MSNYAKTGLAAKIRTLLSSTRLHKKNIKIREKHQVMKNTIGDSIKRRKERVKGDAQSQH